VDLGGGKVIVGKAGRVVPAVVGGCKALALGVVLHLPAGRIIGRYRRPLLLPVLPYRGTREARPWLLPAALFVLLVYTGNSGKVLR